jgi:uncharacterized protein
VSAPVQVPVRDGLFTLSDAPCLLGGTCEACGRDHFPRSSTCPYCASAETTGVTLPSTGRLWAWTAVTAAPPGYRGEVPYGFGVVELTDGLRVLGRLTESDPGRLSLGEEMEVAVVPLHTDDEGHSVVTYAFAPRSR